ncbi:hypothetical protein [Nitrosomonas sp. Nm58]|uniref:hypothetical protein n=1 Tax=Nitrosomonas sp. Nm58 TaxID=200126 RepID=UPI000B811898|nr:hypothetical protein [Nitrosomonas sp. Nm58]
MIIDPVFFAMCARVNGFSGRADQITQALLQTESSKFRYRMPHALLEISFDVTLSTATFITASV